MRVAVDWKVLSTGAALQRVGRYTQHHIQALLLSGADVEVFLLVHGPIPAENALFDWKSFPNVHMVPVSLDGKSVESGQPPSFDVVLGYSHRLQSLLKRYAIDVYHNATPFLYPFYSAVTVCPVVSTFHDADPLKSPSRYLDNEAKRTDYIRCLQNVTASQHVIATTQQAAQDLRLYTGYPIDNVTVVAAPPTSDHDRTVEAYRRAMEANRVRRRRIAVWSSTPPSDCGVADYNAELIQELAKNNDVDVYVNEKFPPSPPTAGNVRYRAPEDYGVDGHADWRIFQLGAREFQWYMYPDIRRLGGTMVLHDISMGLGFYWHAKHANRSAEFEDEVVWPEGEAARENYGQLHAAPDLSNETLEDFFLKYKMLRWLIRPSDRLLVHTQPLREQLQADYPEASVGVVRMGVTDPLPLQRHVPRAAYRSALGLGADDLLVGVFGMMESNKRLDVVIRAFGELLKFHPNALLMFVGRCYRADLDMQLKQWIDEAGAANRVVRLDYAPPRAFHSLMYLADVVVNLRTPLRGGLSAILVRALAAARPTIISDVPEWSTIPSDACLRVRAGDGEAEALTSYLRAFAGDRKLRARYAAAARRWFLENGSSGIMAADYQRAYDEVRACPAITK